MESQPPNDLDYPRWIAEALLLVARRALEEVAADGLPPEHHFVLGIRTEAPGVEIPGFLRQQYPEEVTLILENQFWDLVVDGEGFSVTLAFAGSRHRLFAPWAALTAFADPGARLALRFAVAETAGEEPSTPAETEPEGGEDAASGAPPTGEGAADSASPGEVVRIDRFRRRREDP